MATVRVFQGGNVQLQPGTNARQRTVDYGPGIAATALSAAGEGLGKVADKLDEIEEVDAKVEANRLAVEFSERARLVQQRVKQTLGEGATTAADEGAKELDTAISDILGKASGRARMMLEPELGGKAVMFKDGFTDHGYREKVKAFETTSNARRESIGEEAADEDDEEKATVLLGSAGQVIDEQAQFLGHGSEWAEAEKRKMASGFYRSRALKLANGPNGSALAAIEYADLHRGAMNDDDYNQVVGAYNDNALDEVADAEIYGGGTMSATVQAVEDEGGTTKRALDARAFFNAFTVPHEGAAYVVDSNGAGVKYGINAEYNPGVDIKNLTQEGAYKIFEKKYFQKSGADKLPPALAAVHVDTFYLNEREATRMLKESGGDPDRYIQLRNNFLNGLAAKNPAKFGKYKKGWQNRTNALKAFADRQGGDGVSSLPMEISAESDLTAMKQQTMARTDIGAALKRKIIQRAEQQRGELRQEKAIVEEQATDALTTAITSLGDNFTDVKQLPQDAWLRASPQVRNQFTNMAKGNRENKPLSPDDAAYIAFVEVSDPRRYASKEFRDELMKRGVPVSTIRSVAARQGQIAGGFAAAKPDVIASGELWTVAKPAFEAAGIYLDTLEEKGSKKEAERLEDDQRKMLATNFLGDMARRWAVANPGKKPDEPTIKQWVGYALRNTRNGRGFELNDQQFYDRVPAPERQRAARALMQMDPQWRNRPVQERISDVVQFIRTRAATGL